jgi:hypothetical protein
MGAAVGVLAAVGVPVGIAQMNGAGGGSSASVEPVAVAAWQDDSEPIGRDVRRRADELFASISGTTAQQNAESVVDAYYGNRPMDECMDEAGYPEWDWSLSIYPADPADPLVTNVWLAQPMSRWRSHDLVAARPFFDAEATMNAPQTAEYDDAVTRCLDATFAAAKAAPPEDSSMPRLVERLQLAWWDLIGNFGSEDLPPVDQYVKCMEAADPAVLDYTDSEESFEARVAYAMSGASPADRHVPYEPDDPEQWNDPEWQKFLSLEDEFDHADWGCRKTVYAKHIASVDDAIDQFTAEHTTQIERLRRYWADAASQAAAMGYTGQTGPLEGLVEPK